MVWCILLRRSRLSCCRDTLTIYCTTAFYEEKRSGVCLPLQRKLSAFCFEGAQETYSVGGNRSWLQTLEAKRRVQSCCSLPPSNLYYWPNFFPILSRFPRAYDWHVQFTGTLNLSCQHALNTKSRDTATASSGPHLSSRMCYNGNVSVSGHCGRACTTKTTVRISSWLWIWSYSAYSGILPYLRSVWMQCLNVYPFVCM